MEKIKNLIHNKKFVMFMFLAFVCISATFAAEDTFGLNSKVKILVDLISSPWVKGIACIALIVSVLVLLQPVDRNRVCSKSLFLGSQEQSSLWPPEQSQINS